jgi:putative transposase
MDRKPYPSDLNDAEWELVEPHIPPAEPGGRPRTTDMREVLNAIFHVMKAGCQWELLPHDFPAKGTVYHYFNTWRQDGTWERINAALRGELRQALGREVTPSASIVDSQSVKTSAKGGCVATMQERPLTVVSGISSWTPRVW